MPGTNANYLTNPAVSHSGEVDNLLIERFTGMVHAQLMRRDNLMSQFDVEDVIGTNQVTNSNIGETELQALVPGQEPEAHAVAMDNHSLVVDTVTLARNTIAMLHKFQSSIKVQNKMASNHVLKLVQLQDETILTQVRYGSRAAEGRVPGHFGGNAVDLASPGDELDPVIYLDALEELVLMMNEKEVPTDAMVFACPWSQYYVLMDNEQLMHGEYVPGGAGANGSKVAGYVVRAYGFPIFPTNRIRQEAQASGVHHQLSHAGNGYRYDTVSTGLGEESDKGITNCVGILFGTSSLLVGRTMGVEADVFFNKRLKTWFVDSWQSFGAIADRYEECGAIYGADGMTIRKRFHEANDRRLLAA